MFLNFAKTFLTRKAVSSAALTAVLLTTSMPASAQINLAMFEEHGCVWCEKWNKQIAPIYPKTVEGQIAPLIRYDIHDTDFSTLDLKSDPYFTPTFVLMEDGTELGRIEGYPGEDFFWALLGMLIEKLPEEKRQPAPPEAVDTDLPPDQATDLAPGQAPSKVLAGIPAADG